MRILTPEAMRAVDRAAIEEIGIPGAVLMENAALGVADAIAAELPDARAPLILCGPGNNGGDGLALLRQLATRGYRALAVLTDAGRLRGDAGLQLEVCRRLGLPLTELDPEAAAAELDELARGRDLLVDALFGTGLTRPLEGGYARLVERAAGLGLPTVAIDLPSGLDAGRAEPPGPHLPALLTVAFAAPKVAHVFPPAAEAVGRLVVADLGFPADLVERAEGDLRLLEPSELAPLLAPRARDAHKGSFGHLLVFAGSEGKSGAAILAARAALRAGAGLVTAAVPESLLAVVEAASPESMTVPLPQGGAGGVGGAGLEALQRAVEGKDALAVGPGLGRDPETIATVRRLVEETPLPLVLDADGVNAFAGEAARLTRRGAATVVTPHPMELARLLGVPKEEILADRPAAARRAAEETGAVVVLKGHLTLIADPEGGVGVNPTGNPGMATGGTGDVLTGVVGSLLAQGLDPAQAAQVGVYLHGDAGDRAAARGEAGMIAGDLLDELPAAWRALAEA